MTISSVTPISIASLVRIQKQNAPLSPSIDTTIVPDNDVVTISSAGRLAAAKTSGGYDAAFRTKMLDSATQDPAFAHQAAYEYSHDTWSMTGPLVNISKMPITYSSTGEVVTPENLAAFKSQATAARSDKVAIYDSEKAKGTPDVEILKKLYAATNSMPDDYLSKLDWVRDGAG